MNKENLALQLSLYTGKTRRLSSTLRLTARSSFLMANFIVSVICCSTGSAQFRDCDYNRSLMRIEKLHHRLKTCSDDTWCQSATYNSLAYAHYCVNSPVDTVKLYLNKSIETSEQSVCALVYTWWMDSTTYKEKGLRPYFIVDEGEKYGLDIIELCPPEKTYDNAYDEQNLLDNAQDVYKLMYRHDQEIRKFSTQNKLDKDPVMINLMNQLDSVNQALLSDIFSKNILPSTKSDLYITGLLLLHAPNDYIKQEKRTINRLIKTKSLFFESSIIDRFCCREIGYSYNGQYCEKNRKNTDTIVRQYFPDKAN